MFSILRNPMSSGIRYLEQPTSLIPVIGITPRLQQPNLINLSSLASLNALSLSVVQSYSNRSISSQALSKLTVKYYSNGRNPQTPQKIMLPGLLAISVVINGSNNDQKTYYGKEKVTNIICSNSVTLNGTTVTDRVNVGGSINAINASIYNSINANGSVTASDVSVGYISAGGSISATNVNTRSLDARGRILIANSTVLDHLSTSSSIGANNCTQLGIVKAGGSINIEECANVSSISAGMHIELRQSKVLGDVSSKANATIVNSQINGKLTCCSDHLVIEGSKIEMIDLRVSNNISINGTGIRVNGSTVSISSTSGNSSISLSNDVGASVSISTGSNGIIVNGVPLSKLQAESSSNADKKKKKQIIELKNCTIKDIIFEGGNGQVILAEGSNITGNITGGQIKE